MAKNTTYDDGWDLNLPVASGVVSGDPVVVGQIPGVAQTTRDSDGNAAVALKGVHSLLCEAKVAAGNSAIAVGDILYYDTAETIKINKDVTNGVRFGYALGAVGSGLSGTIDVKVGY